MSHDNPQENRIEATSPQGAAGGRLLDRAAEKAKHAAQQMKHAAGAPARAADNVQQASAVVKAAIPVVQSVLGGVHKLNNYSQEIGLTSSAGSEPAMTTNEVVDAAVEWAKWGMDWANYVVSGVNAGREAINTAGRRGNSSWC